MGRFRTTHWLLPILLGFTCLASLAYEPVQRSLIYLHWVKWPLPPFARFDVPEHYGFAPQKVKNLYLDTHDGATIGAWLVLAEGAYRDAVDRDDDERAVANGGHLDDTVFAAALRNPRYPTVLYFHGNAGTRAVGNRVRIAQKVSALDRNFLIIDYRGFADSSSSPPPSEEGVLIDARRAFDYLHVDHDVDPSQIAIMGQSLGTGIATALAARLEAQEKKIRALILIAPFSSISTLVETYKLGNVIPLVAPFKRFPWFFGRLLSLLRTKFDTNSIIRSVSCPILLVHARDDPVIPSSHSRTLSDTLACSAKVEERAVARWGVVKTFERGLGRGRVVWAEAVRGSHTFIGETEYVMKLVRDVVR